MNDPELDVEIYVQFLTLGIIYPYNKSGTKIIFPFQPPQDVVTMNEYQTRDLICRNTMYISH